MRLFFLYCLETFCPFALLSQQPRLESPGPPVCIAKQASFYLHSENTNRNTPLLMSCHVAHLLGFAVLSPAVPQRRSPEQEDSELVHELRLPAQIETFTFKGETWSSPAELCTFSDPLLLHKTPLRRCLWGSSCKMFKMRALHENFMTCLTRGRKGLK